MKKKRESAIETLKYHAVGQIKKHVFNVNILLDNAQGVAEHPDIIETIEKELDVISKYEDQLEVLEKYF